MSLSCDVVTEPYDQYFGPCDLIEAMCHSKYLYHVIIFVGSPGAALYSGDFYSEYKVRCCRSSDPGEKTGVTQT